MDECDDDTCEYAIEASVVPKIVSRKLLRGGGGGNRAGVFGGYLSLIVIVRPTEIRIRGKTLFGSNANAFQAILEDPNYRIYVAEVRLSSNWNVCVDHNQRCNTNTSTRVALH